MVNSGRKNKITDDQELLQAYLQNGDLEYLADLYNRYVHLVYGVCLKYFRQREESQDAVTEIFESLIEKVRQQTIVNFKSWLYVVTKNHCLMAMRKAKTKQKQQADFFAEEFMESTSISHPIDEAHGEQVETKLRECIEKLKNEQQLCIELFYFRKQCYREIAEKLTIEEKKVKSYIQNGKRNLKLCLEQKGVKHG
ncbi:RNA polymerase sigma factor [Salinivirga cyanobacteriivorans]